MRRWYRPVAAIAGTVVLLVALSPPVERFARELFSAHMVQHLLLMLIAPLLLTVATRKPSQLPSWLGPTGAGTLFALVMWSWHVPAFYDAAIATVPLHVFEHATFVGAGWIFWSVLLGRGGHGYLARLGLTFATTLQSGALGGLIALATDLLYRSHRVTAARHGLTPLEDQQLAGALMWVPTGAFFLCVMLSLLFSLLRDFDRRPHPTGDVR